MYCKYTLEHPPHLKWIFCPAEPGSLTISSSFFAKDRRLTDLAGEETNGESRFKTYIHLSCVYVYIYMCIISYTSICVDYQ